MRRSLLGPQALVVIAVVALVVMALVCCGGSKQPGIAGDSGAVVPTHDAGMCSPKDGATPVSLPNYPNAYLANELPTGSCDDEGASCEMSALATWSYCQDGGYPQADGRKLAGCSLSIFQCTCHNLWWGCEIVGAGASGCGC